ncbi:MAG: DUF5362 family protein [Bacteroidota bacterium]|nr:DUF5362 family protein [Bacteroidota bacterium]
MESFDLLNNDLQVTSSAQNFLSDAARWGKFLSIIGFIFCGFMTILAFFIPTLIMSLPPYNSMASGFSSGIAAGMTILYLLLALLFFFPCWYLFKFSVKMQISLNSMSQENFEESLKNLKSMFKFYGVCTIIMLSIYALVFLIAMIGTAMKG